MRKLEEKRKEDERKRQEIGKEKGKLRKLREMEKSEERKRKEAEIKARQNEKEKLRKLKEEERKRQEIERKEEKERLEGKKKKLIEEMAQKTGFFQKIGFFKAKKEVAEQKKELTEKEQRKMVHEELKSLESASAEEENKKRLNEFNSILIEIDKNMEKNKIKEAVVLYMSLKQIYDTTIKEEIREQGKKIIYNKINEVHKQLIAARKQ